MAQVLTHVCVWKHLIGWGLLHKLFWDTVVSGLWIACGSREL